MLAMVRSDPEALAALSNDPLRFLDADQSIDVVFSGNESSVSNGCSIAGHYRPASVDGLHRPRITIAKTTSSRRRQQFTALHEYGHHLQQFDELADAVAQYPDDELVEEAACDAFAATVLLPAEVVARHIGQRGPSAESVKALYDDSFASRAACAVRASQHLVMPGVVLVADVDGTVTFAAANGDFAPPRRLSNISDTEMFRTALRHHGTGGGASGRGRFTYSTGTRSANLYYDTVWCDGYALVVATEASPAWQSFAMPADDRIVSPALYEDCDVCEANYRVTVRCPKCREPRCPNGHCACTRARERVCPRCFMSRPWTQFEPGTDECAECRN